MITGFLLIPERRISVAIVLRALVAVGMMAWVIAAWNRPAASKMGGDIPCMTSLVLLVSCGLASLWKRDRGLWMLYVFFGSVTLAGYALLELSKSGAIPMGPSPQATPKDIARLLRDAGLGAWVCFLNARLMASVAVLNYRRFKPLSADHSEPMPRDPGGR